MTPPPVCWSCGKPCRTVWAWTAWRLVKVPWSNVNHSGRGSDPAVLWLCSTCVDAAAEGR